MIRVELILFLLGALGHAVLGSAFVNRVHSWSLPRWIIHGLTILAGVIGGLIPLLIGLDFWIWGTTALPLTAWRMVNLGYLAACSGIGIAAVVTKIRWARNSRPPKALIANHSTTVDMAKTLPERPLANGLPSFLSRLPGNEVLKLAVQHKQIALPRLAPEHDGLRIAQISDLHISGRITRPYFEEVVSQTNAWKPDVTVITGDLFDRNHCFDWGVDVLAGLEARLGVYFIFGNHDLLVDHRRLKELLTDAGLHYLGGTWRSIESGGRPFLLVGNELPWFVPAADVENMPPRGTDGQPLRILLSHAPDQIEWANAADFDLMLAGHTHGGQVRFPIVGAIASPSKHGTRYAQGLFQEGNLLLHVSRGTSGLAPLRWNCPPELALLELRCGDR